MSSSFTNDLNFSIKTSYTFQEAIELMKNNDKSPTRQSIRWVDRNGKRVSIGYNTGL